MKKKKGVTLLALVLTIVIMLLLAGIVIQMSLGENGLVAKTIQAQKEQTKAELYDNVKQIYTKLSIEAVRNKKEKPNVEEALKTDEFKEKYNVVGDSITDKKGEVIDTKELVLNSLKTDYVVREEETTAEESAPAAIWPKNVAGIEIQEEDKDKLIAKVKVQGERAKAYLYGRFSIEYGKGIKQSTGMMQFGQGEYLMKISDFENITLSQTLELGNTIEIIQWGKSKKENGNTNIILSNVTNIYEPEPDNVIVSYQHCKFTEIPEWLFSKKTTNEETSRFVECNNITTIPENLFKNSTKIKRFEWTFENCANLVNIPENLFKYNVEVEKFNGTFARNRSIVSIPENLFKHNKEVKSFEAVFDGIENIASIPENLFKENTKVESFIGVFIRNKRMKTIPENLFKYNTEVKKFDNVFNGCNLLSIPENLFKYNTKVKEFIAVFSRCRNITAIPENLFRYNTEANSFDNMFNGCIKISSIPEGLFRYNTEALSFKSIFHGCSGLTNLPNNLFKYNTKAKDFNSTFELCSNLREIPNDIVVFANSANSAGGNAAGMFSGCTSASNYNSLPAYMK